MTSVARIVFKELLRDRTLLIISIIGGILLLLSFLVAPLSLGAGPRMIIDAGFAIYNIIGLVIVIFLGTKLVSLELNEKTIYILLSKPIKRESIIIGKFMGMFWVLLFFYLIMLPFYLLFIFLLLNNIPHFLFWGILFSFLKTEILLSIAIFLSTFVGHITSAMITFVIYIIGTRISDIIDMAKMIKLPIFSYFVKSIYFIFPNLEMFNINYNIIYSLPIEREYIVFLISYSIMLICLFITFASIIFEQKEIG